MPWNTPRRRLAVLASLAASVGSALWAPSAAAAGVPYEGVGHAPVASEGGVTPRRAALLRAREAALVEALGSLSVPVDEGARKAVLGQVELWTGAYRVMEENSDGATITIKVEVEVDLGRLRKRVAKVDAARRAAGFSLGRVDATGSCAGLEPSRVRATLDGFGLLSDSPKAEALKIAVTCRALGAVPFTHAHASRVEVVARGPRGELARAQRPGFAAAPEAATEIALEDALSALADDLAPRARGGVELRIEKAWPAARVRHLERALKEAVLGVDAVELVALEPDGAVRLHVQGNVDPEQLARGLQGLELVGFTLSGFRVDSPHALTVRIVE
jgi:hypothetical protein